MSQNNNFQNPGQLIEFINLDEIKVINLGLEKFAKTYQENGVKVIQVDWRPPIDIDDDLSDILANLT